MKINEDLIFKVVAVTLFIGVIVVMVASAYTLRFGPKKTDTPTVFEYNNFKFTKNNVLYTTQWLGPDRQVYELAFRNLPQDTVDVPMYGNLNQSFFESAIYLTFDPQESGLQNLTIAATDIGLNLARGLQYEIIPACTTNASGCEDHPVVSCEKNSTLPIIYLRYGTPARVTLDNMCITVQGKGSDIVLATDKLLFVWYRIIAID